MTRKFAVQWVCDPSHPTWNTGTNTYRQMQGQVTKSVNRGDCVATLCTKCGDEGRWLGCQHAVLQHAWPWVQPWDDWAFASLESPLAVYTVLNLPYHHALVDINRLDIRTQYYTIIQRDKSSSCNYILGDKIIETETTWSKRPGLFSNRRHFVHTCNETIFRWQNFKVWTKLQSKFLEKNVRSWIVTNCYVPSLRVFLHFLA